jgi:hypothetical protein
MRLRLKKADAYFTQLGLTRDEFLADQGHPPIIRVADEEYVDHDDTLLWECALRARSLHEKAGWDDTPASTDPALKPALMDV